MKVLQSYIFHFLRSGGLMKLNANFCFITLIVIFNFSCIGPRYYTPNRIPVPLFKNKGDYYLDVSSNFTNKGDLTFGYAFNRSFATYAGAGFSSENTSNDFVFRRETDYESIGKFLNCGFGYYLNNFHRKNLRFEIFSDLVLGRIQIIKNPGFDVFYRSIGEITDLYYNYRRIGLISNIAFTSTSKPLEYRYSVRLAKLNFSGFSPEVNGSFENEINTLTYKPEYFLLDYGFTLRYGRKIALQLQFAVYHGLYINPEFSPVQRLNMSLMLGIVIKSKHFSN